LQEKTVRSGPLRIFAIALVLATGLSIFYTSGVHSQSPKKALPPLRPPVAPVRPVTENFYGTNVTDDYRYMENLEDPEVQSWFKGQNEYARAVLESLPGRQKLLQRIIELDESTKSDVGRVLRLPGNVYLYTKLFAGEDTYKLYFRKGLTGQERLVVDPENVTIAEASRQKGNKVIDYIAPSNDLKYVAVAITPGGSEYDTEIHIFEIASGRETGDVITRCCAHANPVWLPDNQSFVYGKWRTLPAGAPVTEMRQKSQVFLHKVGSNSEMDKPVFGYGAVPAIEVDPRKVSMIKTEPNSKYAIGRIGIPIVSPSSAFYIASAESIGKPSPVWRKVADLSDEVGDVVVHGDDLYLLTFKNAPRYRIIRLDARNPDLSTAETIVPPGDAIIEDMSQAQDALYVHILDGGVERVLRVPYGSKAKSESIPLPFEGSASVLATDPRLPGALLSIGSWTKAYKIYAYDPSTKQLSNTTLEPDGPHDEFANVESEEVKVRSHDGTLVPLSIAHPKGMKMDGRNPTLLRAYGAYGISLGAEFDQMLLAWYERGGVNAVCHVRGGGEYGEEWHKQGKEQTKPNTWLDFIACARYLVEKKYTSPGYLAAEGASAGGIPIGRSITEQPDLFAAAIIDYGGVDMLRIDATANGSPNIVEFGSTKTQDGFNALYAMSPLHHVKNGTPYPAVLLTTGINDPRANPWQSGKLAARLQAASTSGRPVLLYVDYEGGHGSSSEKSYQESQANSWSFLLWQFGVPEFQPVQ
jgi:prolyl oligopeptidase